MSRKPRICCCGNFYHVMVQGINKEKIFIKDIFKVKYIKCLMERKDEFNIELLSYCMMNNHAHLLIYCENINNLTEWMRGVNTSFSIFYNKVNKRCGYVFRDRFKSESILNERHLYNCFVYIHRNPINAGITEKFDDYYFSSYNEYFKDSKIITSNAKKILFGTTENYLDTFNELHKQNRDDSFIDEKIDINEYLNYFLKVNNLNIEDVKYNKYITINFIKQAKLKTDAKLTDICSLVEISESTYRRLLKSNN